MSSVKKASSPARPPPHASSEKVGLTGTSSTSRGSSSATTKSSSLGERILLESAALIIFILIELGWWEYRGRYSMAPESSEIVDGSLFVAMTTGLYLSGRVVLYAAGKGHSFLSEYGSIGVAIFWATTLGIIYAALHVTGQGAEIVLWIRKNIIGEHLVRYVFSLYPELEKESFFYARLVALLLFWQCLFGVIYWLGALLLLPIRVVLSQQPKKKSVRETAGRGGGGDEYDDDDVDN